MLQVEPPRLEYSGVCRVPANYCNLRHTNEEFILDFGLSGAEPTSTVIEIDTSLVVSPFTAKRLWMSLGTLIASYEQTFGEIEVEADNRAMAARPIPLINAPADRPLTAMRQFRGPIPPDMQGQALLDRLQTVDSDQAVHRDNRLPPRPPDPNGSPCIPADFGGKDIQD